MRNKLILFFLIWLTGITAIIIMSRQTVPIPSLIYWVVLGLFVFSIWLLKLSSRFTLLFSFGLFILAGLLTALTFTVIAETIMRISLLGWMVGFIQALVEFKKLGEKDNL